MADDNLPVDSGPVVDDSAPLNLDDAAAGLTSILKDDPVTDPAPENEDKEQAAPKPEDDDPLGMAAEDVEVGTDKAGDESEEAEIKGGRFAPDSAKVTLDDGTVTTIAELKRGTLFQRDYTKKTQELSEARKTFEAERQQVSEYAQSLDQSREYLAWYAEQFLPKQPEPFKGDPASDPMGYMQWQHQNSQWAAHVQAYQTFQAQRESEGQKKAGETQKQAQERHKREAEALFKAMPVLKDPVKGKQVWDNIVSGASQLGFSPEEVNGITDHRMVLALRKAIAYDRIQTSAPKVQAEVRKPAVNDGRRAAPQTKQNSQRRVLSERFEQSRSLDDAAAKLRTLIS